MNVQIFEDPIKRKIIHHLKKDRPTDEPGSIKLLFYVYECAWEHVHAQTHTRTCACV
jgi:hypothetical protein